MRFQAPLGVSVVVCAIVLAADARPAAAETFKIAYWNIKSGKGQIALPGFPATFADTSNCTDRTQPLNAWGIGLVPQELAKLNADARVVALGLGEAWLCGNPEQVRAALGWAARISDQNGVSIVARYGFAGLPTWKQLDTSSAPSPGDTKWVVRTPVCLDAACSSSIPVYTAHWNMGDLHAQQTVQFMAAELPGEPHVLIGDLNVWEGTASVCNQSPNNTALNFLRSANYTDAWSYLHGSAEGYTGMTNRAGCGVPVGYTWKRIDYGWSKNMPPVSVTRFGVVTPGHGAPSDHFGIVVEYPHPGMVATPDLTPPVVAIAAPAPDATLAGVTSIAVTASDNRAISRVDVLLDGALLSTSAVGSFSLPWDTARAIDGQHVIRAVAYDGAGNDASASVTVTVNNAPAASADVVLHAAQAIRVSGAWQRVIDATAASGARLWNPDANAPKRSTALAAPTDYVELAFHAEAGKPYRLWIRGKAQSDYWGNDSLFVQFSGSVSAAGAATYRIGTTSATTFVLEDCSGCGLSGWGWQDNGYGTGVLGPPIYFAETGTQTIRLQSREDGLSIDQIVLSPATYLNASPGATKRDTTVLPETNSATSSSSLVAWGAVLDATASAGGLRKISGCNGCASGGVSVQQVGSDGGSVEFVPAAGHRLYAGLGAPTTAPGSFDIAHSFSFWPDGGWDVRERNTYRTEGRFVAGDRFRIALENGAVKYYKNDTLVHVSGAAVTVPLAFDVSLLTVGASIEAAVIDQ